MLYAFDLNTWLKDTYSLGNVTSELLRSYTNDVFLIRTHRDRYVLKLYGVGWRTESEIQYEVALLEHLSGKGLRVANTVAATAGKRIHQIAQPEGERYAVLFEYADGNKPQPPYSNQLYFQFGRAIGRMHHLSDDFTGMSDRRPLDIELLIYAPLKLALPLIDHAEDRLFLQEVAEKIGHKLTEPGARGLDWGPIHGDATLDNLHVTDDDQIILYDFDTGGSGWRAADLQGWAKNNDEYAERWIAFKRGYASVRELKALDLEAAPYLAVAWLIWGLQIDLERRILKQGEEKIVAYLRRQIEAIRQQATLAIDFE